MKTYPLIFTDETHKILKEIAFKNNISIKEFIMTAISYKIESENL